MKLLALCVLTFGAATALTGCAGGYHTPTQQAAHYTAHDATTSVYGY